MTEWLEGFTPVTFPHSLGLNFVRPQRRVVWHTTEGWQAEHAFGVYAQYDACPHFTVQPDNRRRFQHVPLSHAAYSLERPKTCPTETNKFGVIQIEVVGFAAEAGTWSIEVLRWLGEEVLAPILRAFPDIPPSVYKGARMNDLQWVQWPGGQCGHRDVCCQPSGHWDPGDLDLDMVLHYALHLNDSLKPEEDDDMVILTLDDGTGNPSVADGAFAYNGTHLRWVNDGNEYAMLIDDVKAKLVVTSDTRLRATIDSTAKVGGAPTSGRYAHSW